MVNVAISLHVGFLISDCNQSGPLRYIAITPDLYHQLILTNDYNSRLKIEINTDDPAIPGTQRHAA